MIMRDYWGSHNHMQNKRILAAAITLALSFSFPVLAEEAANTGPRFNISRFQVEGNTLLPAEEVNQLVNQFAGQSKDFGDIQRALEALQDAYRKQGFSSVEILLPEQEVDVEDVIYLQVVEKTIVNISIEGNQFHDSENIMQTVPALKEGEVPNLTAVGKSLRVANENPSKQTGVLFKNSEAMENGIDATIKVTDEKPEKFIFTADNTGSRETNYGRLGFAYQNYNLFNKDHRLSVQYITAPHFPDEFFGQNDVRVLGVGYSIPFYERGDSLDMYAAYSDVDASTGLDLAGTGNTNIASKGLVWGVHYNWNLPKKQDYNHKITVGFDYRAIRNIDQDNLRISDAVTATPLSLSYSGQWQTEQNMLAFSAGITKNFFDFASHGKSEDFDQSQSSDSPLSPYLAENDFTRINYSADFYRAFAKNWQFHAGVSGQFSGDHLIPNETFLVGGADSVRGWYEAQLSGDKGIRGTIEAISPDFGSFFGPNVAMRGLVFFDAGHVNVNESVIHTDMGPEKNISSLGFGLRYAYGKRVVARFDYAFVQDGDITKDNPAGLREDGDRFGHIGVAFIW